MRQALTKHAQQALTKHVQSNPELLPYFRERRPVTNRKSTLRGEWTGPIYGEAVFDLRVYGEGETDTYYGHSDTRITVNDSRGRLVTSCGVLPREYAERLLADLRENEGELYIIRSYSTPVAWHSGKKWVMPNARYSLTTTRHTDLLRNGTFKWHGEELETTYLPGLAPVEVFGSGYSHRRGRGSTPFTPRNGY